MDGLLTSVLEGQPISTPVIDLHAHITPTRATQAFPYNAPAEMIVAMDRFGIDQACVSVVGAGFENDEMLGALDVAPGRFVGFVCINPRYPDHMVDELKRCFQHPMVKGIGEVHPTSYGHDYPITGDGYVPAWQFANARRIPVLIHSGPRSEASRCRPTMLGEVAQRFPDMPILVGHSGGYDSWEMLDEAIEVTAAHSNMYLEISAMGRFFGAVEYMVDELGSDRVVFGTDGPFHDWAAEIAHVACSRLNETDKAKIFGGTAERLLNGANGTAVRRGEHE